MSSMFTPDFIDRVRQATLITDVVAANTRLMKKGRMIKALCPFHQEKSPSFVVYETQGTYHCFGCGAHGDAIAFVMNTKKLSFSDAVQELALRAQIPLPVVVNQFHEDHKPLYELLKQASLWYHRQLRTDKGREAYNYIQTRGISDEVINHYEIGFAPAGLSLTAAMVDKGFKEDDLVRAGLVIKRENDKGFYERFRSRLLFPIFDTTGRVVGFGGRSLGDEMPKYLNSPETPLFSKGHLLYGFHDAKKYKDETLLVVEGYMDVISLMQHGFHKTVATLGTAVTPAHLPLLWKLQSDPILCFDGDSAGTRAASRTLEVALPLLKPGKTLRFMFLPTGEDPDTLMRSGQQTLFSQLMASALSMADMLWKHLCDQFPRQNPEQFAVFRQEGSKTLARIEDADLREAYRDDFLKRVDALRFQPKPFVKGKKFQKTPDLGVQRMRPTSGVYKQQCILLATFIKYPALIEVAREHLAFLDIHDPALCSLQQVLLAMSEKDYTDNIHTALVSKGLKEVVNHITTPSIQSHAYFLRKETPIDIVLQDWLNIFADLREKHHLAHDRDEAKKQLAASMTEAEWDKMKTLTTLLVGRGELKS